MNTPNPPSCPIEGAALHAAWLAACKAWSAELGRVFGREAGDARYDKRGTSTPALVALNAEFHRTGDAWRANWEARAQ